MKNTSHPFIFVVAYLMMFICCNNKSIKNSNQISVASLYGEWKLDSVKTAEGSWTYGTLPDLKILWINIDSIGETSFGSDSSIIVKSPYRIYRDRDSNLNMLLEMTKWTLTIEKTDKSDLLNAILKERNDDQIFIAKHFYSRKK